MARFDFQTADRGMYKLLKQFADENRANMTDAESLLWQYMRSSQMGVRYKAQHIIGCYIADFVCLPLKLIIEIDGLYHSLPEQQISDEQRTRWLEGLGYKVLRFTNEEIFNNLNTVIDTIKNEQYKRDKR
mgnify:CR=1 FL=1